MKASVHDLLRFMEETEPKDWPSPRGYGYGDSSQARRLKKWHLWVVREMAERLQAQQGGTAETGSIVG